MKSTSTNCKARRGKHHGLGLSCCSRIWPTHHHTMQRDSYQCTSWCGRPCKGYLTEAISTKVIKLGISQLEKTCLLIWFVNVNQQIRRPHFPTWLSLWNKPESEYVSVSRGAGLLLLYTMLSWDIRTSAAQDADPEHHALSGWPGGTHCMSR